MTTIHPQQHAEFDRDPVLFEDLAQEFGTDGLASTAARIIVGELADFPWDGRIAEMNLSAFENFGEEEERFERVAILGHFHGRYCDVDEARRFHWMTTLRPFETFEHAENGFLAGARDARFPSRKWCFPTPLPVIGRTLAIVVSRGLDTVPRTRGRR